VSGVGLLEPERICNSNPLAMKSVCIVVQHFYDLDYRVRRKAEALVEAGFSVDVLALRMPGSPKKYTLNGVNVHAISLGKLRGSLARYAFEYFAFFLWVLVRLTVDMQRRRYVIVDVNTLPDFLVFAGVFAKKMGAKLVLDMHEITPEFYMSKYGMKEDSWWIRILKFQEKISFDFADHVITISEPIRDLFVSRGLNPEKSTVIMNSAEETRFAARKKSSDQAPSKPPGTFVMMYHGTLTRIYGLEVAIEALSLVHKELPEAQLWLLGSGPEENPLKQLAEKRGLEGKVRLVGQVSPAEIPDWLNQCDAGILPLHRDVFLEFASPNKLPEFIIMGKPVIMSRLKATRHYFSEDAIAFFEPDNPEDLAKQMVRLYCDGSLRTQLAAQARQEYAPIRWDVMKQRYLKQMEDMVGPSEEQRVTAASLT
jgi:glycosyltransferase involved in cell wall biosynthesis